MEQHTTERGMYMSDVPLGGIVRKVTGGRSYVKVASNKLRIIEKNIRLGGRYTQGMHVIVQYTGEMWTEESSPSVYGEEIKNSKPAPPVVNVIYDGKTYKEGYVQGETYAQLLQAQKVIASKLRNYRKFAKQYNWSTD